MNRVRKQKPPGFLKAFERPEEKEDNRLLDHRTSSFGPDKPNPFYEPPQFSLEEQNPPKSSEYEEEGMYNNDAEQQTRTPGRKKSSQKRHPTLSKGAPTKFRTEYEYDIDGELGGSDPNRAAGQQRTTQQAPQTPGRAAFARGSSERKLTNRNKLMQSVKSTSDRSLNSATVSSGSLVEFDFQPRKKLARPPDTLARHAESMHPEAGGKGRKTGLFGRMGGRKHQPEQSNELEMEAQVARVAGNDHSTRSFAQFTLEQVLPPSQSGGMGSALAHFEEDEATIGSQREEDDDGDSFSGPREHAEDDTKQLKGKKKKKKKDPEKMDVKDKKPKKLKKGAGVSKKALDDGGDPLVGKMIDPDANLPVQEEVRGLLGLSKKAKKGAATHKHDHNEYDLDDDTPVGPQKESYEKMTPRGERLLVTRNAFSQRKLVDLSPAKSVVPARLPEHKRPVKKHPKNWHTAPATVQPTLRKSVSARFGKAAARAKTTDNLLSNSNHSAPRDHLESPSKTDHGLLESLTTLGSSKSNHGGETDEQSAQSLNQELKGGRVSREGRANARGDHRPSRGQSKLRKGTTKKKHGAVSGQSHDVEGSNEQITPPVSPETDSRKLSRNAADSYPPRSPLKTTGTVPATPLATKGPKTRRRRHSLTAAEPGAGSVAIAASANASTMASSPLRSPVPRGRHRAASPTMDTDTQISKKLAMALAVSDKEHTLDDTTEDHGHGAEREPANEDYASETEPGANGGEPHPAPIVSMPGTRENRGALKITAPVVENGVHRPTVDSIPGPNQNRAIPSNDTQENHRNPSTKETVTQQIDAVAGEVDFGYEVDVDEDEEMEEDENSAVHALDGGRLEIADEKKNNINNVKNDASGISDYGNGDVVVPDKSAPEVAPRIAPIAVTEYEYVDEPNPFAQPETAGPPMSETERLSQELVASKNRLDKGQDEMDMLELEILELKERLRELEKRRQELAAQNA